MSTDDTTLALANTILDVDEYCLTEYDAAVTLDNALQCLVTDGGNFDLPFIVYGLNGSPLWDVSDEEIRALARLYISVLQQQGYNLSGTLETTDYSATDSSVSMTRTRTQFSFNAFGETFKQTRQSIFLQANNRRRFNASGSTSLPTIMSYVLNASND